MIGRLQRRSEGIARLRIGSVATLSRDYQENRIRPLLAETYVVLKLEPGVLDVFSHAWCCTSSMSFSRTKGCPHAERPLHCTFLGSQPIMLVGRARKNSRELHRHLVDVAPAPTLAGLEGGHDRVLRRAEVLRRMLVLRAVATADVPAGPAQAQVYPLVADR
jgi:hypothetical protein